MGCLVVLGIVAVVVVFWASLPVWAVVLLILAALFIPVVE